MCEYIAGSLRVQRGQVQELGLSERVRFLPSFTDAQRAALLAACAFVVYTPQVRARECACIAVHACTQPLPSLQMSAL